MGTGNTKTEREPRPMTTAEGWCEVYGILSGMVPLGLKKMIQITIISVLLILGLAAKKNAKKMPVFGQLTLTGEMALDWLKPGLSTAVRCFEMASPEYYRELYNLPEWAYEKTTIGIIHPLNKWANKILVTQASVLRQIEAVMADFEEQGAAVSVESRGKMQCARILFEENPPVFKFDRDPKAGKFAPYIVEFE